MRGNRATAWGVIVHLRDSLAESGTDLLLREADADYWTASVPFEDAVLDTLASGHARSGWGVHLVAGSRSAGGRCTALRLIWEQPPIQNRYLRNGFHPSLGVADGVEAALDPGLGPVVRDATGAVMFRLQWHNEQPPPGILNMLRAWCALLASSLFLLGASLSLKPLLEGGSRWPTLGLFLALLVLARWAVLHFGPWSVVEGLSVFDPSLFAASAEMPSLGDLLIDIALVAVIVWSVHLVLKNASGPRRPMIAMSTALLVLSLFAEWIDHVLIALVRDSRIPLDLFHVQDMNGYSVLAMLAIAALLACWLFMARSLVRWSAQPLTTRAWTILLLLWFGLWFGGHHALGEYDSVLAVWPLPALLLLRLLRADRPRSSVYALLLACLALFTVHMLNRQSFKRVERDMNVLAEAASSEEDPVIEALFHEAVNDMRTDADANRLLGPDSGAIATSELDQRLRQRFFRGPWEKYAVRLNVFRGGRLRGSTSPDAPPTRAELAFRFGQGTPVSGDLSLRNTHRPTERAAYIGLIDGLGDNTVFVELMPNFLPEGLGFPELLLPGDGGSHVPPGRYVRARYERGTLVESTGPCAFPTAWTEVLPEEGMTYEDQGYTLRAKGDARGTVVVVGVLIPTWLEHLTTFSYVMVLFTLLAGFAWLLRTMMRSRAFRSTDLAVKVRSGVLAFAGIALLMFTYGTQRTIGDHIEEHTRQQLDESARSAIAEMRQHIHGETRIAPEQYADIDHWLDDASNILLTDLTLYTPEGGLMATSREQVFNTGLLGTRMDPDAFTALAVRGANAFMHDERIGRAVFRAAYRPFLNDRGEVLAFLALPYFARQAEVEQERASGFVSTVNLFVLLFVLSIVAATLITNWTTRPLELLKRGLEHIQLGARNEPIVYSGNDELGELVRVYNNKVEELRESAERLARSERESAWKEMAKQVAHEIKNPLTPMKLGIQHFQHTWDPLAPDAKTRLDRFTSSMVEQIDALSRVAGDFSRFAQMSAANETLLDLNEVAKSSVALFAGGPNADISLKPASPLMVKADREHLLRVFNNLLKNAQQAIPEGRDGKIEVVLRAEADQAIIEVRDNGAGIPEDVRDRIFEPNFTTKTSGMGLGLAMVKRMVEQAGGSVHFTTRPGEGTSFHIVLPLVK